MEYTTVVGIDGSTLRQFRLTWPTWMVNKPSILYQPLLVFYDRDQVTRDDIFDAIEHPNMVLVAWPFSKGIVYEGEGTNKWNSPQRAKMLAGFVHVASTYVKTDYWLKVDTDVVATGMDDWIDQDWFVDKPAIVAPKWGYTKPANQMVELDGWFDNNFFHPNSASPLNLFPEEGANKVRHRRICSWCAFFYTPFTLVCSEMAEISEGSCRLPVPSQDGYMWYLAKRGNYGIREADMKSRGWVVRNGEKKIKETIEELRCDVPSSSS